MSTPPAAERQPAVVALFGTSADPPTLGHQALLEGLLQHFPLVATWASDNPFKEHGAPLGLRSELLDGLVRAIDNPRLLHQQQLSSPWAIETLARARQRWPSAELVFVIGGDLLPQVLHWKAADQVLASCKLAVVPRQGWPLQEAELQSLQQRGGRVELLALPIPASASSQIRQQLRLEQVPPSLRPVLVQHNLYGLSAP